MNINNLNTQLTTVDDQLNQIFEALKGMYLIDSVPESLRTTQDDYYNNQAYLHIYNNINSVINKLTALVEVLDTNGFMDVRGNPLVGINPVWGYTGGLGVDELNNTFSSIISDLETATNNITQAAKINGLSI